MKPEIETQASRKGNNMPDAKALMQGILAQMLQTQVVQLLNLQEGFEVTVKVKIKPKKKKKKKKESGE